MAFLVQPATTWLCEWLHGRDGWCPETN